MILKILITIGIFATYIASPILTLLFYGPAITFVDDHPDVFFPFFASYLFFGFFLWFFLEGLLFVMRPKGSTPVSLHKIKSDINEYFSSSEAKKIVLLEEKNGKIILRWAKDIHYNQLVNTGEVNRRISWILHFHDRGKIIRVNTVQKEFEWSLNPPRFRCYYMGGIEFERSTMIIPSMSFLNGKLLMDPQKISYNSSDIFQPIARIAAEDGWTITSGSFQSLLLTNVIKYASLAIAVTFAFLGVLVGLSG